MVTNLLLGWPLLVEIVAVLRWPQTEILQPLPLNGFVLFATQRRAGRTVGSLPFRCPQATLIVTTFQRTDRRAAVVQITTGGSRTEVRVVVRGCSAKSMSAEVFDFLEGDAAHGVVGIVGYDYGGCSNVANSVDAGIADVALGGFSPGDRVARGAEGLR